MNCPNCGAPMRLFAQAGYFACDYCRTSHFPSPSPDGVRQFGEAPEGWRCSLCNQILHRISVDDRYQGHQCPRCQGLLLARPAFGETVHTRRLWAGGPTDPPRMQDGSELHRAVDCPACRRRMQTHPYYGPGMLIIDTCDRCNLIWLRSRRTGARRQRARRRPRRSSDACCCYRRESEA